MRVIQCAWDFLMSVPRDRRWLTLLIPVNLLGSLYGFNWYKEQLAGTALRYWPVVPDSPLSCLLFSFVLILIYARKRFRPLEGVAYISMLKYGFWTMFVFAQAWIARKAAFPEEMFLFASHFGMAIEAVLFSRYFSPGRPAILACGLWSVFNDYMDYFRGFHPTLPMMEFYQSVRVVSMASTYIVILGLILWGRDRSTELGAG
ncbi:MAG: DUF1405 domain-containing protein [Firmicutes bacterium]|nr:DUF1405 domain-containing protein [Bacillota bacterium]